MNELTKEEEADADLRRVRFESRELEITFRENLPCGLRPTIHIHSSRRRRVRSYSNFDQT